MGSSGNRQLEKAYERRLQGVCRKDQTLTCPWRTTHLSSALECVFVATCVLSDATENRSPDLGRDLNSSRGKVNLRRGEDTADDVYTAR